MAGDDDLISVPFRYIVWTVAGLPSSALFLCIFFAILLHYDDATATHCNVANWLPSVSAAVATYSPEKYIWRVFLGLHGAPRILLAFAFRNFLLTSPMQPFNNTKYFRYLCNIACFVHLVENAALLLLTAISSTENHDAHKIFFGIFAFSSLVYMLLATWLFSYSGRRRAIVKLGEQSYEYKCLCFAVSILSLVSAMFFFVRHNAYCEPGVYTLFAISEYMVILSNIGFHSTLYLDFHGKSLSLTSSSRGYEYLPLPTHIEKST